MEAHRKQRLIKDLVIIVFSIIIGIFFYKTEIIKNILVSSGEFEYLGIFIAGMFFTSVFTTVPATVVIGEMSTSVSLPLLVGLSGTGALLGDFVIFKFFKDSIGEDLEALFTFHKTKRWKHLFKTRLFKIFITLVGGIIIASPLPDELGLALMGFSKTNNWSFAIISLLCNSAGILIIALVARAVVN